MNNHKIYKIFIILALTISIMSPVFVSAAPSAGIKPGSVFYFFDTAFEKINLFFTFNPDKKARKALEYAEERLAEVEAVANKNKPEAVAKAMENYQENIALATIKAKEIKNKTEVKNLLSVIADSTSKHQKTLANILEKVPNEVKDAIVKAIEVSKKGQEEAMRQVTELKKENKQLKKEIAELKAKEKNQKSEEKPENKSEGSKADDNKEEIEQSQLKIIEKIIKKPILIEKKTEAPNTQTKQEEKQSQNTATSPNETIVEMDKNESTTKTIKEAPQKTTTNVIPKITQNQIIQTATEIQITSININTERTSAEIEWQTNEPTEAKVFISGNNFGTKVFASQSNLSTRHLVSITGLTAGNTYSYEIEVVKGDSVIKRTGVFKTNPDELDMIITPIRTSVQVGGLSGIRIDITVLKNGQIQSNQKISMTAPDFTQDRTTSSGVTDFTYFPKTVGTHTLTFSWNGLSKSIDIEATPSGFITVSLSPDTPSGGNITKGAKSVGLLKLNFKNTWTRKVQQIQIDELKLRLVGGSSSNFGNFKISDNSIKPIFEGDIIRLDTRSRYVGDFDSQILIQADIPLTANTGDVFYLEFVSASSSIDPSTSVGYNVPLGSAIGNSFTISQPPITNNSPTLLLSTDNSWLINNDNIGTALRFDAKNNPFSILKLALTFSGVNGSDISDVKLLIGGNVKYKLSSGSTNSATGQKMEYMEGNKIIFQNFSPYELFHVNRNETLDLTVIFEIKSSGVGKTIRVDLVDPLIDIIAFDYETGLVLPVSGSVIGNPMVITTKNRY